MIEVRQAPTYDVDAMRSWLTEDFRPHLRPDVSNYAKGRLRVWLGTEPSLTAGRASKPGLHVSSAVLELLEGLIGWPFDYCLLTYSGDAKPIGITPHRDANYAAYEAYGLNLVGECRFSYWNDRKGFSYAPPTGTAPMTGPPTDIVDMVPGTILRFCCKNAHSAEPGPGRWGMNFWRARRIR